MEEISASADNALMQCQRVLSNQGRLSTAIVGFVARDQQIELASNILHAIEQKSTLVAEAGTGTGKTYAYLVPCLLSGKKAVISTATKTLQDQLFQKDLPVLTRALGLSVRIQNLKGRANYICRYRVALHAEEGRFMSPQCAKDFVYVQEKLAQLTEGERGELPELSEGSPAWPYVTSTVDNCLGVECGEYQSCFLVKARKRALDADVVVINHHLYFADSRLKEEGFGELLPGADVVVFDEAHQLAEIASNFHGERVGTRQLRDLLDDSLREWPALDLANQPLKQLSLTLDEIVEQLLKALPGVDERLNWEDVSRNQGFMSAWRLLLGLVEELLQCFTTASAIDTPGFLRCKDRLIEHHKVLQSFSDTKSPHIRWLERFKQTVVFHVTPHDVADAFRALMVRQPSAYVFTSATLTMASSFDCFTVPLGLTDAKTLLLPSPFDFKEQALLYFPRGLPESAKES